MMFTLVPTAWALNEEENRTSASMETSENGEGAEESGSVAPAMRGNCGAVGSEDSVQWALADDDGDGSYTLTISGSGAMANYTANINNEKKATQPWRASETGVEIEKITKVVVSEGVTSIGAFAFNGLTGVSEYDIGANVNTISQWALETSAAKVFKLNGNTNFQTDNNGVLFSEDGTTLIAYPGGADVRDEYTVPSTVTAISDGAFVGCPIKKLTIDSNVTTELPGWSFNGGVLEELDVNCLFGKSTFAQITTLKKVTLGDSIKEIPQMAFLECKGLQTVSIPSGLTKIGTQAFFGCSSLQDVTLPESLTEIGYQAFRDCDALTSITFPDSLEKVGEQAFLITTDKGHTGSLTTVTFGKKVPTFLTAKGDPSINPQLFTGQDKLTTVDMSKCENTTISAGLFNGLTSLETIIFPTGLAKIGDNAFTNCKGLKSLEFPDSLTEIGESAFSGCTGLTYISYGNGIDDIGRNAFGGCTNVKVIDLHRATKIDETYDNGNGNGDPALTHACIAAAHNVKYYLRTVNQANNVKGNLEWGSGGPGTGNISNTYYILTAKDAVPDYTGQTDTPTRAGYTFGKWKEVTVSQGSTSTKNVYADDSSWSLASPTVTVSPASANTYVNGSAVTLTAKVSEPVHGFTYSYQWYSNTSSSTEGSTAISTATSATYSPDITAAGTTYYYCVVTVTNGSDTTSATTAVVPVTVASQAGSVTISNKKTAATYGDEPFTFTYEASKAATVTSSDPSVATVQDNNGTVTVTIVGAGTTEISVSFDADTNYSAASDKFTLTVDKAKPTVKISADPTSLTGSGTVKLTVTSNGVPTDGKIKVTCDNGITVTENEGGISATLPNETKTYTFTATYAGDDNHEKAFDTCQVPVTRRSSSGGSSSSDRSYAVSAPSAKNGDVTVSPKNASKGDRVTITVTPDKGYELDKLTVKDASGNKLKLTDKGNGKYTFTMPGSKVTVSAEFVEEQAASIFADVPADAYYAKAVEWAVKKGITNGKANGLFGSNDPCTRGQIVTFLWRAAGSPAPKGTAKVPADVLPGSYCYDAVAWALENGITNGLADGTFGVNNTCTRGQSVTFLYRAMGTAPTTVNGFTDVAAGDFYAEAVAWAVENGVTSGMGGGLFGYGSTIVSGWGMGILVQYTDWSVALYTLVGMALVGTAVFAAAWKAKPNGYDD